MFAVCSSIVLMCIAIAWVHVRGAVSHISVFGLHARASLEVMLHTFNIEYVFR